MHIYGVDIKWISVDMDEQTIKMNAAGTVGHECFTDTVHSFPRTVHGISLVSGATDKSSFEDVP